MSCAGSLSRPYRKSGRAAGVDLRTLPDRHRHVRNINGCGMAGLTRTNCLTLLRSSTNWIASSSEAKATRNSPICRGNSTSRDRCMDNCTHSESQDIALVPAKKAGRLGFTSWGRQDGVWWIHHRFAAECLCRNLPLGRGLMELIKIYRDHGPREARSKCRFAF